MFADFNKIFSKNQENNNMAIPDVIIQQLNKSLENGLKYIDNGNGQCALTADGKMTIGGLELIVDDDMRKYLGENLSYDDIYEYSYNTQRPLKLKCKTKGYVLMNGQSIPVEKLCFDPYKNIKFKEGEFLAIPAPFPKPYPIVLGDGKYEIETMIRRIPCDERFCLRLETIPDSKIFINMKINEKSHRMNCNIKLNLVQVSCVQEIVSAMSVFYALGIGNGLINGVKILLTQDGKSEFEFDKITLEFWKKVLEIETLLKCSFIIPQGEIDYNTIKDVERLYQMLIMRKPIRMPEEFKSLKCGLNMNEGRDIEEVKKGKGTFVFDSTHIFKLFGVNIELPSITVMTDVIVSEIIENKDEFEFIINNNEVKAFCSELVFVDEVSRSRYRKEDSLTDFYVAKTINDYLINR